MTATSQQTSLPSGSTQTVALSPSTGRAAPQSKYDPIAIAVAVSMAVMTCQTLGIQIETTSENSQLSVQELMTKISDTLTQKNIENTQKQIDKMAKMHIWGTLAKVFGVALLLVTAATTILSGGICSGLMMLLMGAIAMSGMMGSDGAIGKTINDVADAISKDLGIKDPAIMRAICDAVVVVSMALVTAGSSALDGLAAKGITQLTGYAFKTGTKAAEQAATTAAKKLLKAVKAVFANRPLTSGVAAFTQLASSSDMIQEACQALSDAIAPNGGKDAKIATQVITEVLNISMMLAGIIFMGGHALSTIDPSLRLAPLVRNLTTWLTTLGSTGQVIASLGGGAISIEAGVTKLKGATDQASLIGVQNTATLSGQAIKANQSALTRLIQEEGETIASLSQLPAAWSLTGNQMASPAA